MTTKIYPRSPRKRAKDAAYAALGPIKVLKPLRFLRQKLGSDHFRYREAHLNAKHGDGGSVQFAAKAFA